MSRRTVPLLAPVSPPSPAGGLLAGGCSAATSACSCFHVHGSNGVLLLGLEPQACPLFLGRDAASCCARGDGPALGWGWPTHPAAVRPAGAELPARGRAVALARSSSHSSGLAVNSLLAGGRCSGTSSGRHTEPCHSMQQHAAHAAVAMRCLQGRSNESPCFGLKDETAQIAALVGSREDTYQLWKLPMQRGDIMSAYDDIVKVHVCVLMRCM